MAIPRGEERRRSDKCVVNVEDKTRKEDITGDEIKETFKKGGIVV